MKKLIAIILPMILGLSMMSQIENSGFEDWDVIPSFSHPDVSPAAFVSINTETYYQTGLIGLYEVPGQTGSGVHVETLLFENEEGTDTLGGFGIFGNAPNDDGDDLIFSNGFPYSDMSVSGITMDLRYDINPLSPGFVLVQFLAGGVPVSGGPDANGTYLFPISGVQSGWMSFTFDFVPGLTQVPDECVIAFASNNLVDDDAPFFPGDFLEIDNIALVGTQTDVPGGDFETWIEEPSTMLLNDWQTYLPQGFPFIVQSEDSYEGDFSASLETLIAFEDTVQSMIYQGEIGELGILTSQLLEDDSYALNFQYQFMGGPNDFGSFYLILADSDDPEPDNSEFYYETMNVTDGWTEFNLDFSDIEFDATHYAIIFFSGGGFDVPVEPNTVLMLDDVEFLTGGDECEFVPTIVEGDVTLCPEETLFLTTQDYDEYSWLVSADGDPFEEFSDEASIVEELAESGQYEVILEATLDGCTAASEITTIQVYDVPDPTITIDEIELCEGEAFSFSVDNDADFVTFQWFYTMDDEAVDGQDDDTLEGIASGESSTSYYVDVASALCPNYIISSDEVTVVSHTVNIPEITQDDHTLSTGQFFSEYQWYFNGTAIPGAINDNYEVTENGTYSVVIVNGFGCEGESIDYEYSDVSISDAFALENVLNIYPNPTNDDLFIENNSNEKLNIEIYNLLGSVVFSSQFTSVLNKVDVSELSNGSYVLKITDGTSIMTQSLIVSK